MAASAAFCTNCSGIALTDSPTEPFHCPRCGHDQHQPLTPGMVAATRDLAEWTGEMLCDNATGLTCGEAELFCAFFREFGHPGVADQLLELHAEGDDEGDDHGIGADGKVFTRS
ncbi:hypothetical protein [Kitasatospora griseola]|uniref:hypothetical protein n=1 Tax=Kitasatospora griseola TaxID=2064 RepID=UPI003444214B